MKYSSYYKLFIFSVLFNNVAFIESIVDLPFVSLNHFSVWSEMKGFSEALSLGVCDRSLHSIINVFEKWLTELNFRIKFSLNWTGNE